MSKFLQRILANPDLVGERFNNGPDGWRCRIVNDNLISALCMEAAGVDIFNHGSGETLATSIAVPCENQKPWFGYFLGSNGRSWPVQYAQSGDW